MDLCRSLIAAALLALLAAAPASAPRHYRIDPAASEVAAKVAFFGLSSKTARFPQLSGGLAFDPAEREAINLEVEIDARTLTAPDPVTLGRLKSDKFFWVERYPTVRFAGRRMVLTSASEGTVAGHLTARGVTHPATLAVRFAEPPLDARNRPIELVGTTAIDRRAFGMTAYALVVGRKVGITIRARLVPSGAEKP